ncbi:DUF6585 family protein [Streptomyces sp. NPDC050145]|uniref:DUF6585 family protein n=1 Tax=Streptomyces sp. NPDC050145 TaxID=3365602 RepID=UPI003793CE14
MSEQDGNAQVQAELARRMDEAARGAALGRRRGVYEGAQPEKSSISFSLGAAVVLAVVTTVLVAAGMPGGAAFSVLFLVIAVGCWVAERSTAAKNARIRLHLYESGLVAAVKKGVRAVRYDTTHVLQSSLRHTGVGGYTEYTYKLTDTDGVQVVLEGRKGGTATGKFARHEEWGHAVQEGVTRAQLPVAIRTLNAGQRVDFGKLWVTRDGVGSARDTAQWHEIEELQIVQGFLKLKVAGKWRSLTNVAVATIPNFFVFLTIADQLRGPRRVR